MIMKKKILFCLIGFISFVLVLTRQNINNSGELVIGNIEALSQTENEPPFNQLNISWGQLCETTGPNGITYWGKWCFCVDGWTTCQPQCIVFW